MHKKIEAADKNKEIEALSKIQVDGNEKVDREQHYQSSLKAHIFAGQIRDARGKEIPQRRLDTEQAQAHRFMEHSQYRHRH